MTKDERFFKMFIDESEQGFKQGIIAHCRTMEAYDVYEWVANDEDRIRNLITINSKLREQKEDATKEFKRLKQEKKKLISYLKYEDIDLKENIINLEEKLRNTPRDSFYYNSYLKTLHRFRAKRELIKEILSKIEKSDNNG